MHLIQILLPLYDNGGRRLPLSKHEKVKSELTKSFGGLTAYTQAPAEGLWAKGGTAKRDQIVIYEVMAPSVKNAWWDRYRVRLEKRFRQQAVVIRAQKTRML